MDSTIDIRTILDQRMQAWRDRDTAALTAVYAEDAVLISPMFPRTSGREAIGKTFEALYRSFPDWEMTFEEPCLSANRAMQPCIVRATHGGDFMGIPASGRRVEFECVLILDFRDGLIVRERRVYDFTGLLIQAGVLRGKPAH